MESVWERGQEFKEMLIRDGKGEKEKVWKCKGRKKVSRTVGVHGRKRVRGMLRGREGYMGGRAREVRKAIVPWACMGGGECMKKDAGEEGMLRGRDSGHLRHDLNPSTTSNHQFAASPVNTSE